MKWYIGVLKQYADFHGRARRKEYWMFFLVNVLVAFGIGVVTGLAGAGADGDPNIVLTLYQLAVLVPAIAVGVRRMHDTDHSGWWLLFPIVNLVLAVREGQQGPNRFGPDPKGAVDGVTAAA